MTKGLTKKEKMSIYDFFLSFLLYFMALNPIKYKTNINQVLEVNIIFLYQWQYMTFL